MTARRAAAAAAVDVGLSFAVDEGRLDGGDYASVRFVHVRRVDGARERLLVRFGSRRRRRRRGRRFRRVALGLEAREGFFFGCGYKPTTDD